MWQQFPEGGSRLGVLQAIAEASNEQGNCYVTVTELGAAARLSRRAAQRGVNQLREDRWIVTSRMLGQGARLVFQLNLPKLARSCRTGVSLAAMHAQRVRPLGATEEGLRERVALRGAECQRGTASVCDVVTHGDAERHADTAPCLHTSPADGPADAREEALLPRQETAIPEEDAEGDFQGAEVRDGSDESLYGAATASFEAVFEPGDELDDFSDEIAAMRQQAEKQAPTRVSAVPRA